MSLQRPHPVLGRKLDMNSWDGDSPGVLTGPGPTLPSDSSLWAALQSAGPEEDCPWAGSE